MVAKKMPRLSSRNSKHKMGYKGGKFKEDMISRLPDEILGVILSLLTLRDATRTCVISRRWERLFTLFTGSFVFDFEASPFTGLKVHRQHERSKYIDWVNKILTSIHGNINEFIVRSYSDEVSKCHIDRWVGFAFKKRVQRLELHSMPTRCQYTEDFVPYTFPVELCAHIKEPSGLYTISCLTSLCLKYVEITGELVEYFISNCPLLERLCVTGSEQLINLKVIGAATLRLEFLEISSCFKLESLEVSAPNLVSFIYFGPRINLLVENNPKLLEVSIGQDDVINLVHRFSSYFTQIESLTLAINIKDHKEFSQCIKLPKVKHLTLQFLTSNDGSILGWTSLISCCPFLHKLTLKTSWRAPRERKMQKLTRHRHRHECLRVVELVGFGGHQNEIEFVTYLLASSTALEKIIVNCCSPYLVGTQWETDERFIAKQTKSRGCALRLSKKLPPNVDFVLV